MRNKTVPVSAKQEKMRMTAITEKKWGNDKKTGSSGMSEKTAQKVWGYAFVMPALLILGIFMLLPIVQIFFYSVTDWNGAAKASFIGVKNYIDIFNNPDFYTVLKNNLIILILGVPLWTIFPLVIAMIIYEEIKGYKFFKTVYFFPSVLSIVIVGTLFKTFFGYVGPVNMILRSLGLEKWALEWLAQGITSLPIIVLAVNWAGFGSAVLIYLAAMSAIDTSTHEAAQLDGANWWQKSIYITLPGIRNVVQFTIVLNIIHAFSQMFSYVLVMTNGGPGYESTVLEYFIYLKGFKAGDMGYASALSVILFVMVCIINVLQSRMGKKED